MKGADRGNSADIESQPKPLVGGTLSIRNGGTGFSRSFFTWWEVAIPAFALGLALGLFAAGLYARYLFSKEKKQ